MTATQAARRAEILREVGQIRAKLYSFRAGKVLAEASKIVAMQQLSFASQYAQKAETLDIAAIRLSQARIAAASVG